MRPSAKKMLWAFCGAAAAGICLHFVYTSLPNPVTALVSPVKESVWEHLKILFWPYLGAALVLTRGGEKGCRAPWLLSLLIQCGLMLALGGVYHLVLHGELWAADMGIYLVCMGAGFVLPRAFRRVGEQVDRREAVGLAVIAVGAMLLIFTFLPPRLRLFEDLSVLRTWVTIPRC